jgi:hypothetical protein
MGLAVLVVCPLFLTTKAAPACSSWWGCNEWLNFHQSQYLQGYQGQAQEINGGMNQSGYQDVSSGQWQSTTTGSYGRGCNNFPASQHQEISGRQIQGQEQLTGYGYQLQFSEQSATAFQYSSINSE